jgi:hypothetical protein
VSATLFHYRYAGHRLASALPLPELPCLPAGEPDFFVEAFDSTVIPAAGSVDWQHNFTDSRGAHAFRCFRVGDAYGFDFPCVAQAWVTADNRIALSPSFESSPESLRHVLLDQVLPRVLAQRGHLVMHGAAVHTPQGRTLLMLGDSGAGKSTLAAAFANAGAEVLSDDGVLLDLAHRGTRAVACYSGLRLWPDSLSTVLAERADESTPMSHYNDKRRLMQPISSDARHAIDAVLLLQQPSDAIVLAPVAAQAACMALVANAFQLDLGDHGNLRRLLAHAAEAVRRVPVLTLAYPRDYALLPDVVQRIEGEIGGLSMPVRARIPAAAR